MWRAPKRVCKREIIMSTLRDEGGVEAVKAEMMAKSGEEVGKEGI